MQLHTRRIDLPPVPAPPERVRVRSSAVGLCADHLPARRGLGQVLLSGEALVPGEVTLRLLGHRPLTFRLDAGATAMDAALELAAHLLRETALDASVAPRGPGFSVTLGVKAAAA